MTKIFNKVHESTTKEMHQCSGACTKQNAADKFNNAAIMESETKPVKRNGFDILKEEYKKNAIKVACYCLVQAENKSYSLLKEFATAKVKTNNFTLVYTESENKGGEFKEKTAVKNTRGESRVFWHKIQDVEKPENVLRCFYSYRKFAEASRIEAKEAAKIAELEKAREIAKALNLTGEQLQAILLLKGKI